MSGPAIRLSGIVKRYPGVVAVDHVDLEVGAGEVHALAGENGAGKSTLMRILYGLTRADEGVMELDGAPYAPANARDALARGVGMVHQHFMLVPTFTALDNAMLGSEPLRMGRLDRNGMRQRMQETAERFGLDISPDTRVEDLSVGEKQRLEILKVLLRGARTLILDEPTAVLAPSEARALFATVARLAGEGTAVIFITHKLNEVVEHADRVTVMRAGKVAGTVEASDTNERELARLMVGRDLTERDRSARTSAGIVVLALEDAGQPDAASPRRLDSVTLDVAAGEIVAIAGVEGNGQRELGEIVTGLRPFRGEVQIAGRSLRGMGPGEVRRLGVAHIPEDRLATGVIPAMTVAENLMLGHESDPRFRGPLGFAPDRIDRHARERIAAFDIRPDDPDRLLAQLSGGNQQKVVIARETEGRPTVLLAAHPTRGVDVGASEAIHDALLRFRELGCAVLLISADLNEIRTLADRVFVLYSGRLNGEFSRAEFDEEEIGVRMIGGTGAQK